jgi:hypothetical protein
MIEIMDKYILTKKEIVVPMISIYWLFLTASLQELDIQFCHMRRNNAQYLSS